VYSVVNKTQGLSPVASRESNHRTRRTHGNERPLFPWFPCFPWLNKNPGTVPGYQPRIQPPNTPNTRKRVPSFSLVSVFSVVSKTQGLSPVTSQESNHRTRRTHGNQSAFFFRGFRVFRG